MIKETDDNRILKRKTQTKHNANLLANNFSKILKILKFIRKPKTSIADNIFFVQGGKRQMIA